MKTCLKLLTFAALSAVATTLLLTAPRSAVAQQAGFPGGGVFGGGAGAGAGVYEPSQFRPVVGDLNLGVPGRVWLQANYADEGLGYDGSYATLGAKRRIGEDFLGGRWLVEGRAHWAIEDENFFSNIGIERVYSIKAAEAEVSTSIWYDYDGDSFDESGLNYNQIGLSASLKTRNWDLIGNGYFPVGTTSATNGTSCFFGHSISIQPLVDSALEGFDATVRWRPSQLRFANGTFDIGGYGYTGDNVEFFGGGRARLGLQLLRGAIVTAEVNYDQRFEVTGLVGIGWTFGGNPGTGSNYAGIGRDLETTVRNDHIVRGFEAAELAIDPDTGLPYNVVHVDNSADAAAGDGTFENPFTTLADAEANSAEDDIIFVDEGNGTSSGMQDGINLQDGQLLLADGVQQLIPLPGGQFFELCNDQDGQRPTIAGSNNGAAVTLANRNTVRGFIIDGNEGVGGQTFGIVGDGRLNGSPIDSGIIENNIISNSILHGIFLDDIVGDWRFAQNDISNNGFDGIRIFNACDPNSIFEFVENDITFNGRDGISIENYDAQAISFLRNVTSDNNRDGVRLLDFKGTADGRGANILFQDHNSINNAGFGINIENGSGNLTFLNPVIQGNAEGGIRVVDFTANALLDGESVIVDGGNITGNIAGPGLQFTLTNGGVQDLLITNTQSNGNGMGLQLRAENASLIRANVVDNISFNANLVDGIQALTLSGATIDLLVDQPTAPLARLPILGNGQNGINLLSGDSFVATDSEIFATILNTNITGNAANGINAQSILDGFLELDIADTNIDANGGIGVNILTANAQPTPRVVNRIQLDRVTTLDNGGSAIILNTGPTTFTDLLVRNSDFTFTTALDAGGDNNAVRLGGFLSNGIQINAAGNDGDGIVDSRTRFQLLGSSVTGANLDGVEINTTGDASLLTDITGNTISLNGFIGANGDFATGGGEIEAPPVGTGLGAFFNGFEINATGNSDVSLRLTANDIGQNSELGVGMFATGGATINALWTSNDLSANDTTDDISTLALEDNNNDWTVFNGPGSNICLAMTNNNDSNGQTFINASVPVDFVLELDGLTNGFGAGAVPGNITIAPFGSTCEGLIAAEEAAFASFGFPPTE